MMHKRQLLWMTVDTRTGLCLTSELEISFQGQNVAYLNSFGASARKRERAKQAVGVEFLFLCAFRFRFDRGWLEKLLRYCDQQLTVAHLRQWMQSCLQGGRKSQRVLHLADRHEINIGHAAFIFSDEAS